MSEENRTQKLVGFDPGSKEGDCAHILLTRRITQEEYAAILRAQVPPGDPLGRELLKELAYIASRYRAKYPNAIIQIQILAPDSCLLITSN